MTRLCLCTVVVLFGLALAGCVERKLLIRSEPEGARVILNGEIIGATPVDVPFMSYGTFEFVATAPQHARLRQKVPIAPPWYEHIPLDFVVENFWPFTAHDYRTVTLTLSPLSGEDAQAVDAREEELRRRLHYEDAIETPK